MKFSFLQLKPTTRRGYTLLFSVIVSVLILSVAAFILSISRKQFILSSAARDSTYAFYAADSGMECAVENRTNYPDLLSTTSIYAAATGGPAITISCGGTGGVVWSATPITSPGASRNAATTTWEMSIAGSNTCAVVAASYVTANRDGTGSVTYSIESRGYNIGWDPSVLKCNGYGSRRVERALRYTLNF